MAMAVIISSFRGLSCLKKSVIFLCSTLFFLLSFLYLPSQNPSPLPFSLSSDLSLASPPPPPTPISVIDLETEPIKSGAGVPSISTRDSEVRQSGGGVPPPDPEVEPMERVQLQPPPPDPPEKMDPTASGVLAPAPSPPDQEVEVAGNVEDPTMGVGDLDVNADEKGDSSDDPEMEVGRSEVGIKSCDLYQGSWVKDEEGSYPLYAPRSCPYVDEAYSCQENGRKDVDYMKWRWKPNDCNLPRFNATDFLERLRGKRLMLVGDSMNRNQFESMLCLLREALPDKSKVYETRGYKITKGRGYFIFLFVDYQCTIEFVRSHFLVREGLRVNRQGNTNPTLAIDRIDKAANRWKKADILIFNTGHWWTHGKTARGKNYYVEGGVIYPKFDAIEAFKRAMKTWGRWINNNMKHKNKLIFYRGYSAAHFRGGDWDSGGSCHGETVPALSGSIIDSYPLKMKIVQEVIGKMKVPVVLLNVTKLTNFRKDGHPSIYGKNITAGQKVSRRKQDCSHWCLPGVPDSWNELIYATLVLRQQQKA